MALALAAASGGDDEGDLVCGDAALAGERCSGPRLHGGSEIVRGCDAGEEEDADDGMSDRIRSGVLINANACVIGGRNPTSRTPFADGIIRHLGTRQESPVGGALGNRVDFACSVVFVVGILAIRAHLTGRIGVRGRRSGTLAGGTHDA